MRNSVFSILTAADILSSKLLLCLVTGSCLLFAGGCDVMPPSSLAPAATEHPATAEPQPVVQTMPSPWDVGWIPGDSQAVAGRIDSLLDGTGLSGHGGTILEYAQGYGVNPAFALAMFRKEAEFAKQGSIAHRQNNPGNIICGGGTTPLYGATGCGGRFGIYDTMADGIRAYFWLLDSEYKPGRKYDCEDIPCVITVYCPPSDCDTARYVEQVVEWTIRYQSLLSTEGPLVLQPAATVRSIAVTIVPATVVPEVATPTALPAKSDLPAGRIAFDSERDGEFNFEIYVMNADGSGQMNLTNNPASDYEPSWSPDGTQIAFESTRDGNLEIYVMSADGTGVTRLTNDPALDYQASWSPNGDRIAFHSYRDDNDEIYIMNADGSGQRNLTNNLALDGWPCWSPDGTRIGFVSNRDGNYEIYVMNVDGGGAARLTHDPHQDLSPSWSPDGTRIAFESNRNGNSDIYVMYADGRGQMNLTNHPAEDWYPCWSPDGTRITFESHRDDNFDIYVMNADGAGVTRLTHHPADDGHPCWSPS